MFPFRHFFDDDEEFLFDDDEEAAIAAMIHHRNRGEGSSRSRGPRVRRSIVRRDHAQGELLIMNHYFGPNPVYPSHIFRSRY